MPRGIPKQPRKNRKIVAHNARKGESNPFTKMWREQPERMRAIRERASKVSGRKTHQADGYSAKESAELLVQAKADAERIMRTMEEEGLVEPVSEDLLGDDKGMSNEALKMAIILMRMPGNVKDKLAAARTVLEYTRAKPASKQDVKIDAAEDFLGALLLKEQSRD